MTLSITASGALARGRNVEIALLAQTNGVDVRRLRDGQTDLAPLFMVPGLEGEATELAAVAASLVGPHVVYALSPTLRDEAQQPITSVERIASLMVAAIGQIQPSGPYRLAGYSFGGLIAFEIAQQLRARGDTVEALFLIEAVYDERYWPRWTWLGALTRRTVRHLRRIALMRPTEAFRETRVRASRLVRRLKRRSNGPDRLQPDEQRELTARRRALMAIAGYRPSFFDGGVTLIASSVDRHFGCDTVRLWRRYARHIDVEHVEADHVTIMQEPASVAVADAIDGRLANLDRRRTGLRPMLGFSRPLIVTTMRWFSTARLAHALATSGFCVSVCRPRSHVLAQVEGLACDTRLGKVRRLRSVANAIRRAQPDVIIPDDERALALLRRLCLQVRASDPATAALIERSLGRQDDWCALSSRAGLTLEAAALGLPGADVPLTRVVATSDALDSWVGTHGLPVVLKTDGSWGGRGTAIVRRAEDLHAVWRRISNPPSLIRALKRAVIDTDHHWLGLWARRARPVVNAQQFLHGREAIATAACVDGAVTALTCFEVVQATAPKGPAAVVRVIDHAGMVEVTRALVERFGLSGFCGLDFLISENGNANLLELNLRATPTCHLLVEGVHPRGEIIRLFPADPIRSAESGSEGWGLLDVPVGAPSLIRVGERMALRAGHPVSRLTRRLAKRFRAIPD